MPPARLEIYSSMECPYAYLATYRLRQLRDEFAGRVQVVWRALSLEYVNRQSYAKPLRDAEMELFARIEPALPFHPWARSDWEWPVTFWPAFESLACAQAQGSEAAFEMSWRCATLTSPRAAAPPFATRSWQSPGTWPEAGTWTWPVSSRTGTQAGTKKASLWRAAEAGTNLK
jgi:hypothetical protein